MVAVGTEFTFERILTRNALVQSASDGICVQAIIEGLIWVRVGYLCRPVLPIVLNTFQHKRIHVRSRAFKSEKLGVDEHKFITNFVNIRRSNVTVYFLLLLELLQELEQTNRKFHPIEPRQRTHALKQADFSVEFVKYNEPIIDFLELEFLAVHSVVNHVKLFLAVLLAVYHMLYISLLNRSDEACSLRS